MGLTQEMPPMPVSASATPYIFLNVDQSQAEARVVYVYSKDRELIEIARSKPWEYDIHRTNAALVFSKPVEAVTKQERRVQKPLVHGSHYDSTPNSISRALLKEGHVVAVKQCAAYQETYMSKRPAIRAQYHRSIIDSLIRERKLTNSWGITIDFRYERLEPGLYRRGFAWKPQSDVGIATNQLALIPLHNEIIRQRLRTRINLQSHDGLVSSVPPDNEAWQVACFLRDRMEVTRRFDGVDLQIPVTFALGNTLACPVEFKQFPSRDDFMDRISMLAREARQDVR